MLDRLFPTWRQNKAQKQFNDAFARDLLWVDGIVALAGVRRAGVKLNSDDEHRFLQLRMDLVQAIVLGDEETVESKKEACIGLCQTSAPFTDAQLEALVVKPARQAWAKTVAKRKWQGAQFTRAPPGAGTRVLIRLPDRQ